MLLCLTLVLSVFVACDKSESKETETSASTTAGTSADTTAATDAGTTAATSEETSEETSVQAVNYEVTKSEWDAFFGGNALRNVTANATTITYASGVAAETAPQTATAKLAGDSLQLSGRDMTIYMTSHNNAWYLLTQEGSAWYGYISEDPFYNVSENHIFDYIHESAGFFDRLGGYEDFTYDAVQKCYSKNLGVLGGVYHTSIELYFENGSLVKMNYVSAWTSDSIEFKNVQSSVFVDYGTTVVTVPAWTAV